MQRKTIPTRFSLALTSFAVLLTLAILSPVPALALSTYIAESYTSEEALPMSSIVSLKENASDSVVATNTGNVDTMIGVVIDRSDASISVSNGKDKQVQVAKNGTLQVLVSDINGSVEQGDYVTGSPINGVGMRATGSTKVIGIAQNSLTNGVAQKIKGSDGVEQNVKVGTVTILVSVSGYIEKSENSKNHGLGQDINKKKCIYKIFKFVPKSLTLPTS